MIHLNASAMSLIQFTSLGADLFVANMFCQCRNVICKVRNEMRIKCSQYQERVQMMNHLQSDIFSKLVNSSIWFTQTTIYNNKTLRTQIV